MDDQSPRQTPNREELVIAAQNAARAGKSFHEILALLRANVEPSWPGHVPFVAIEWCLIHAFDMPLRDGRDIERWNGFSDRGDWTDADIDDHFAPWLIRYQARIPQ